MSTTSYYEGMLGVRSLAYPNFEAGQVIAAEKILRSLEPYTHCDSNSKVTHILELGCGTGEILTHLAKKLPSVSVIGYDVCWESIARAAKLSESIENISFSTQKSVYLNSLKSENIVLAVLCIGHTILHCLDGGDLIAEISTLQPDIILFDLHEDWATRFTSVDASTHNQNLSGDGFSIATEHDNVAKKFTRTLKKNDKEVFSVEQFSMSAKEVIENFQDAGYTLRHSFRYDSGWGPMRARLLHRNDLDDAINRAFRMAGAELVLALWNKEGVRTALHLFDEQIAFAIWPIREDAIFISFLPHPSKQYSSDLSELFEIPYKVLEQQEVPSGEFTYSYNAHAVALAKVASPVFLREEDSSKGTGIYLDIAGLHKDVMGSQSIETYFVLPIYVGSLPIAILLLGKPVTLDLENTNPNLFYEAIGHVWRQMELYLDDTYFLQRFIARFIHLAIEAMERNTPTCSIPDGVTMLADKISKARTKPWKSIAVALPTVPVNQTKYAKRADGIFDRVWKEETERLTLDHALRICYWFQQGGFFEHCESGHGHDYWNADIHKKCMQQMRAVAGIEKYSDLKHCSYFARSNSSYLLAWVAEQMLELERCSEACERESTQAGKKLCKKHNSVYQNLKAVFCKAWENKGEHVRFSFQRLVCILIAACRRSGDKASSHCVEVKSGYHQWRDVESKLFSEKDPTIRVADLIHALAQMSVVEAGTNCSLVRACSISGNFNSNTRSGIIYVITELRSSLSSAGGGSNCAKAVQLGKALFAPSNWLFGNTRLCIKIDVSFTNSSVDFEVTFPTTSL